MAPMMPVTVTWSPSSRCRFSARCQPDPFWAALGSGTSRTRVMARPSTRAPRAASRDLDVSPGRGCGPAGRGPARRWSRRRLRAGRRRCRPGRGPGTTRAGPASRRVRAGPPGCRGRSRRRSRPTSSSSRSSTVTMPSVPPYSLRRWPAAGARPAAAAGHRAPARLGEGHHRALRLATRPLGADQVRRCTSPTTSSRSPRHHRRPRVARSHEQASPRRTRRRPGRQDVGRGTRTSASAASAISKRPGEDGRCSARKTPGLAPCRGPPPRSPPRAGGSGRPGQAHQQVSGHATAATPPGGSWSR